MHVEGNRRPDRPEKGFRLVRPLYRFFVGFLHDQKVDVAVGIGIPEETGSVEDNEACPVLFDKDLRGSEKNLFENLRTPDIDRFDRHVVPRNNTR